MDALADHARRAGHRRWIIIAMLLMRTEIVRIQLHEIMARQRIRHRLLLLFLILFNGPDTINLLIRLLSWSLESLRLGNFDDELFVGAVHGVLMLPPLHVPEIKRANS